MAAEALIDRVQLVGSILDAGSFNPYVYLIIDRFYGLGSSSPRILAHLNTKVPIEVARSEIRFRPGDSANSGITRPFRSFILGTDSGHLVREHYDTAWTLACACAVGELARRLKLHNMMRNGGVTFVCGTPSLHHFHISSLSPRCFPRYCQVGWSWKVSCDTPRPIPYLANRMLRIIALRTRETMALTSLH